MSLIEHLRELRTRLALALLAILIGVVAVFLAWEPVYDFLRQPYCATPQGRDDCRLASFGIFDQFKVRLRVSFIGGFVLAAPVWLYQLGAFITPALHRKERRYVVGFSAAAVVLFAMGAVFAFLTVSRGLAWLLSIGGGDIEVIPSIQSYLSFITLMLVAFGVSFEFPLVVLFLHLMGVFSADKMRSSRRGMILGLAVASAVITPTSDPVTFLLMLIPLYALYEGCIVIARLRERRQRSRALRAGELVPDDKPSAIDTRPSDL